jgi:hypothetical protein
MGMLNATVRQDIEEQRPIAFSTCEKYTRGKRSKESNTHTQNTLKRVKGFFIIMFLNSRFYRVIIP